MKKLIGLLVLLLASEILGGLCGQIFFGLFEKTVPPAVLTSFNHSTVHAAFVTYGLGTGFLMFALSLAAIGSARLFSGLKK